MLGVPSQNSSEDLYTPKLKASVRKPELADLFRLAAEVRDLHGVSASFEELDGEFSVVLPAPVHLLEQSETLELQKSLPVWPVVVVVGAVLLTSVGWKFRQESSKTIGRHSRYRPATAEEAHRFLSQHSVDPFLYVENRPFKKVKLEKAPDLVLEETPAKPAINSSRLGSSNGPEGSFLPMPVPLKGQIEALPDPSSVTIVKQPLEHPSGVSLHDLEAELRGQITEHGGKIKRVSEEPGANSKIFYVAIASRQAHDFSDQIRDLEGSNVSVLELGPDELDSSGSVPSSSDVAAAETNVASLKKQLDQAEISFYPEAPALSGLRAQYGEAVKKLAAMKRVTSSDSVVRIELIAK